MAIRFYFSCVSIRFNSVLNLIPVLPVFSSIMRDAERVNKIQSLHRAPNGVLHLSMRGHDFLTKLEDIGRSLLAYADCTLLQYSYQPISQLTVCSKPVIYEKRFITDISRREAHTGIMSKYGYRFSLTKSEPLSKTNQCYLVSWGGRHAVTNWIRNSSPKIRT